MADMGTASRISSLMGPPRIDNAMLEPDHVTLLIISFLIPLIPLTPAFPLVSLLKKGYGHGRRDRDRRRIETTGTRHHQLALQLTPQEVALARRLEAAIQSYPDVRRTHGDVRARGGQPGRGNFHAYINPRLANIC